MRVLLHKAFKKQSEELVARKPDIEGPLITALQEIKANPLPGTMQGVVNPRLKGVIHKKHVGGPNGHRLLYLYLNKSDFVIPVYISLNPKSTFDYDQVNWEEICGDLYNDYRNKNYKAFTNWSP